MKKLIPLILSLLVSTILLSGNSGQPTRPKKIHKSNSPTILSSVVNDDCSGAITLTPGLTCSGTVGSLAGATPSTPLTYGCDGYADNDDDVWYSFTATAAITQIDVHTSDSIDGVLEVLTSCTSTVNIGCSDLVGMGLTESVTLTGLTIGNAYYIKFYDYYTGIPATTSFTVCVVSIPPPANDNCAGAITLSVGNFTCNATTGNIIGASESMPPLTINNYTSDTAFDIWYSFVATAPQQLIKVTGSSSFDAVVVLYDACNGNIVDSVDASADGGTEKIFTTGLTIGNTYYVRVYEYGSAMPPTTTFDICISTVPPPPANDECAGAITVTVATTSTSCSATTVNTTGGTPSGIASNCWSSSNDDDVWYTFTATANSIYMDFSNFSAAAGTIGYSIYTGSCSSLTEATCGGPVTDSIPELIAGLTIGQIYYVNVFYVGTNDVGTFDMCIYQGPPPPSNDNCSGAITVTVAAGSNSCSPTHVNTLSASTSHTLSCTTLSNDDDVWYQFTANSANLSIDFTNFANNATSASYAVYTGSCGALAEIDCNSYITGIQTITGLSIGTSYYLQVMTGGTGSGTFDMCLYMPPPPPANDNCSSAIAASVSTSSASCTPISVNTMGATSSYTLSCTVLSNDDDVWYKFTATSSIINIDFTNFGNGSVDASYALYAGACNSLVETDCNSYITGVQTITGLSIGTAYYLQVMSAGSGSGTFDMCLYQGTASAPPANDNCSGAIGLTVNSSCTPTVGTIASATQSLPPLTINTYTSDSAFDVWYSFVATAPPITINVTGASSFDAVVVVYNACNGAIIDTADSFGGGAMEQIITTSLTIGNTYYVRVYDYNSPIPVTPTFSICVYSPPLGVESMDENRLSLYPNPATNKITLSSSYNLNESVVSLFNSHGQAVSIFEKPETTILEIDLSEFSNGIYYIQIKNESGTTTRKIIKQ